MKNYSDGKKVQIAYKLLYCEYSVQMIALIKKDLKSNPSDNWLSDRTCYYLDNFFIHFADVMSCFHKNDEQELFNLLEFDPEDRNQLHKLRGVATHIVDFEEAVNTWSESKNNPKTKNAIYEFMKVRNYFFEELNKQNPDAAKVFIKKFDELNSHFPIRDNEG